MSESNKEIMIHNLNNQITMIHQEIEKYMYEIEIVESFLANKTIRHNGDLKEEKEQHQKKIYELGVQRGDLHKKLYELEKEDKNDKTRSI